MADMTEMLPCAADATKPKHGADDRFIGTVENSDQPSEELRNIMRQNSAALEQIPATSTVGG